MNIKNRYIMACIPFIFTVSFLLYYSHKIPILVCNLVYLGIAAIGGIHFFCVQRIKKSHFKIGIFCILLVIAGISSGIHTQAINFSIYFKTVCYVFLSLFILEYPPPCKIAKILFYGVSFWFIIILLNNKIDPNNYFRRLSRNYYSVLSLEILCLYYVSISKHILHKIPLFPALIYSIISFLAVGRSGIFSSILLVFGVIYINYWLYSSNIKEKFLHICFLILLLFLFLYVERKTEIINWGFSRFRTMGLKSQGRSLIWKQYFNLVFSSLPNLLLGSPIKGIEIFEHYEYNLHNSFLQMHFTYGLLFSIFVGGGLIYSLYTCYKKREYLIVLLAITFLFRSITDQLGFAFFTEFLFYYFLFYGLFFESKNKEINLKEVNQS